MQRTTSPPTGVATATCSSPGTLKGQLTIASENNVNAVGNVTYNGGLAGTDLLGLVANNYVQIYHPVSCTTRRDRLDLQHHDTGGWRCRLRNARIDGAILSLAHSFRVQNWSAGAPLGTLTDQRRDRAALPRRGRDELGWHRRVGVREGATPTTTGCKYLSPPKFLDPVAAAWGANTWAEIVNPSGLPA